MSRRTVAGLVATGLFVVLAFAASRLPVPYVTVSPGPTVDVLAEEDGEPRVSVEGRRTYDPDGELRLTTVRVSNPESRVSLVQALGGWLRDDVDVLPYEAMYPEASTADQERAESAAQMVSSQDTAVAAALTELGYELATFAEVTGVYPGGPSEGRLEPRDRIVAIGGTPVDQVEDVLAAVEAVRPGDRLRLEVRRDGRTRDVTVTADPVEGEPGKARIGVLVGTGYDFPFQVSVGVDESIGGPSAGLVFALSVYDVLTPGSLTGGADVAGTGTIAADGTVGPIGGIRQKIVGAREAGARLFLVPPGNCATAVTAEAEGIRLVRADTLRSAVQSLQTYAENPSADLPRCPS